MIENIKDINDKLTMFLPISLKARIRFIYIFLIFLIDKIKENIDKIKEINKLIINVINSDFKILKNKLNDLIIFSDNGNEINNKSKMNLFENIFNNFADYLNNILISKEKFISNVAKNKIPWKLVNSLLSINKSINNNDKNKIRTDLKCNYVKEIQIIYDIFSKYN